ncbi:MAG: AmmeMemoRadiSam system radical SAM enzyme [Bacteroidales bacterium]|nr:AmmeMemoRadiSam system radical SAM enzyme [Bacteroidales bacterium]
MFYEVSPRGVTCLICPNECTIKEGETGDCRSRVNYGGKLYSIAYGNPCAVHIDPIEKKPLYHFLPGSKSYSVATAGCNLACLNCQNWTISQVSPRETRNYDLMPDKLVEQSLKNSCKSIAYTYSEPVTFYEYTYDSSKLARSKGIKNVLVSAGYINEKPLRELAKYIDAANIDLKSFKDSIYLKLNGGRLQPVLNTLLTLKQEGVWLEITNLLIPGWTDDLNMISEMCKWLKDNGFSDTPLHFSRFYPQYKLTQLPPTPLNTLIKARETALKEGLKFVYIGNVPGSIAENTICPNCKKVVVERKGYSIVSNNIVENKCKFCNHPVPGVWN